LAIKVLWLFCIKLILFIKHNSMASTNQNIFKEVRSKLFSSDHLQQQPPSITSPVYKGTSPNHPRGSQPCILGSTFSTQVLIIPFKFSMVSESGTKSSLTVDTAFRKDLPCRGVQRESRRSPEGALASYPRVPSGSLPVHACTFALFQGEPAEWARLQPLPCSTLTQDHQ